MSGLTGSILVSAAAYRTRDAALQENPERVKQRNAVVSAHAELRNVLPKRTPTDLM